MCEYETPGRRRISRTTNSMNVMLTYTTQSRCNYSSRAGVEIGLILIRVHVPKTHSLREQWLQDHGVDFSQAVVPTTKMQFAPGTRVWLFGSQIIKVETA